jgi:hypothetical protein
MRRRNACKTGGTANSVEMVPSENPPMQVKDANCFYYLYSLWSIYNICGALNLFVKVARIRSDAF